MVALDRHTGDLRWSSPLKKDSLAYSTPILLNLPKRDVLVGTSRNYIHVVDRQDGELLSSYQLEDIKLQLSEDGKTLKEVWRNRKVVNVFEGFVVVDNWLYATLENKELVTLDTETGRIRHSVRAESGNIVYADHKTIHIRP
jgi:outer membrane protein assembly factor BamB